MKILGALLSLVEIPVHSDLLAENVHKAIALWPSTRVKNQINWSHGMQIRHVKGRSADRYEKI